MIKICVFSDSHGCASHMLAAIEKEAPALCFFLGDGERDLAAVQARFPSLPVYAVRGNCDPCSQLSASLVCAVGPVRIFAAHGHQHNVKYEPDLETLADAAKKSGASVALFGHTHHARLLQKDGLLLLNPGSIGRAPRSSYALLLVDEGIAQARHITV